MAEQHRRRHKAHLDQHIKDANGEYHYIGEWYAVAGGWRALVPFCIWAVIAAAAVIDAGCVPFDGLKNTWYVIIPYILTVSMVFALGLSGYRLVSRGGRLKTFEWEKVSERIVPITGFLVFFDLLTGALGLVFLLKRGSEHYIAFFALVVLAALSAFFAGRAFRKQVWEKTA